ncbi:MAG TPA: hypothetical protein VIP05_31835 [Burkholderiaceae bacterium]
MQVDLLERASVAGAPLRKAAMLLHSMGEADRRWLLDRLDAAQRPRIEALLEELRVLEFPADADLVRESLVGAVAARPLAGTPASGPAGWSVEQATRVLLPEPDEVIALLLRAGDWPWAAGLRSRLGVERVRRVEASRYSRAVELPQSLLDAALAAARARFDARRDEASPDRVGKASTSTRRTP